MRARRRPGLPATRYPATYSSDGLGDRSLRSGRDSVRLAVPTHCHPALAESPELERNRAVDRRAEPALVQVAELAAARRAEAPVLDQVAVATGVVALVVRHFAPVGLLAPRQGARDLPV